MTAAEEALLKSLLEVAPGIAKWIGGVIDGNDQHPEQTRRVRDVLPERSASAAVADELRSRE